MKTGLLPKDLDLRGLAARGVVVKGTASLEAMPRLREAGIGLDTQAVAEFRFSRDEEARYIVESRVEATLTMVCQRCLGGMELPLVAGSRMACVWDDSDALALPGGLEPLMVGEVADLSEIAEEEILLAVPVSPTHDEDCLKEQRRHPQESEREPEQIPEQRAKGPFAVLEKLRS